MNKELKLDQAKMLGFKIQSNEPATADTQKIGAKIGDPKVTDKMGAKIGVGKKPASIGAKIGGGKKPLSARMGAKIGDGGKMPLSVLLDGKIGK